MIQPIFKVNFPAFGASVDKLAQVANLTVQEATLMQGRLVGAELMKRTPPFSGRSLTRMLEKQGKHLYDAEIESLSARKVGERRVEKDIRKVVYGVRGAAMPQARNPKVFKSQNNKPVIDFGVLQKCEGKNAVRIFATKGGEVYGVDTERFLPNATLSDLAQAHQEHRTKRGRVTTAGQRDRVVGRWRWLNVIIVKDRLLERFIKQKQKMVGQAKGGWVDAFIKCGGQISGGGWVGRHRKAGTGLVKVGGHSVKISYINRSQWAGGGDPTRVVAKTLEGRERAMHNFILRRLKDQWGAERGGATYREWSGSNA
jgi:hypothetical protein